MLINPKSVAIKFHVFWKSIDSGNGVIILKKWENGAWWFKIGVVGSIVIFIYLRCIKGKWFTLDTLKYIGSYIAGVGVFFSYFYNKREERKIKVHSEADWRGRLFDLAKKRNVTYRDILYFLTFFNNNAEPEDECDYRLLQAIGAIVNNTIDSVDIVHYILYLDEIPPNNYNCRGILKCLSKPDTSLNGEQRAAFQLCIEFLLKDDWDKQMNKK